jgi:hypothetical protein
VSNTCHLDIVPYATTAKWNELKIGEREYLIKKSEDILGLLLRESNVEFLILNGQSVVENFQKVSGVRFNCSFEPLWDLYRVSGKHIKGKSYIGHITRIGNIELKRDIKVIGYNHNVQSSFGITKNVMNEIKHWVSHQYNTFKP